MKTDKIKKLFNNELVVLNVGLEIFHKNINEAGGKSIQMRWHPPAGGDEKLLKILQKLKDNK